ncbi:hypothetical protein Pint_03690 [Pistacia integerrima]|uniref:Uncharacterized protein n=1 Tax=Pistacia integerrima TaxID=434235 RepID=A0ACC0Z4M9_9ROSI|nr:hypothetical protein Pint_03690 [Pistacia integerrima]
MAVLLLRHRKASAPGISSILRGHVESFGQTCLIGALVGVDVMIKKYSNCSGTTKFDFADLTHLLWTIEIVGMGGGKKVEQEREEVDGAKHKALTVEMADVTTDYDCL